MGDGEEEAIWTQSRVLCQNAMSFESRRRLVDSDARHVDQNNILQTYTGLQRRYGSEIER